MKHENNSSLLIETKPKEYFVFLLKQSVTSANHYSLLIAQLNTARNSRFTGALSKTNNERKTVMDDTTLLPSLNPIPPQQSNQSSIPFYRIPSPPTVPHSLRTSSSPDGTSRAAGRTICNYRFFVTFEI